ncbi:hypothetical protein Hamer_G001309 [Homarus americanus]|uniref:Uncharacterized protein n=1 Tax=Homarus americanus TaxID=6706 RepID=A0A8J5N9H3_HOMAM|nr:hypothetical protein Hamer_G001309 [Homarus americanus]
MAQVLCPGQPVFYTKTNSITEVSLYLNQPCLQEDGDPLAIGRPSNLSFLSSTGLQQSTCYIGSCGTTVLRCWQALQAREVQFKQ